MADNVTAPAAGVVFATDDIAGVHWPLTKLAFGPDNSATPVADAAGARLPVVIGGTLPAFASPPAVTIGGTLPGFASPPAVTIGGSLPGFASPPAVTISGSLPAFASPPTVELGATSLAALESVSINEPPVRTLANNISLAAGAASTAITAVAAGSYIFEAIFTGSDLQLQRLGPDGATWINAGTLATSGSVGVVLAANDTLRLRNASAAAMSAITARVA